MSEKHPHLGGWSLLPTAPDTCPECGVKHEPTQPHNQQSLAYQYHFYGQYGRWPTWTDAMAHSPLAIQAAWRAELSKRGVSFEEPKHE